MSKLTALMSGISGVSTFGIGQMTKKTVLSAIALIVMLSGCATRDGIYHNDFFEKRLSAPKVLIADPSIIFFEIGVSQQKSRRVDLEAPAKAEYLKAVAEYAKETSQFKPVPLPNLTEAERYDLEQRMLMTNYALWIHHDMKILQGRSFSDFDKGVKTQVGPSPTLTALADRTGAEYALMTVSQDIFTTPGAKVLAITTGVLFLGNTPFAVAGVTTVGVSLVEMRTGKVLWTHVARGPFDMAKQDGQVSGLRKVLKDSPFTKG